MQFQFISLHFPLLRPMKNLNVGSAATKAARRARVCEFMAARHFHTKATLAAAAAVSPSHL